MTEVTTSISRVFSHGGAPGDIIYHLPFIRRRGGGTLVCYPTPKTGYYMTPERTANLAPLLEAQPYIEAVRWAKQSEGFDLEPWRDRHYPPGTNLTDMLFIRFDEPRPPRTEPWLEVDPHPVARVVFARSARYQNPRFPWRKAIRAYGKQAVFVGFPEEYQTFRRYFNDAPPYYPTVDMLQLARVIAGCDLMVCNQSSPLTIAEGLKKSYVLETCVKVDTCRWDRPGAVYGVDARVKLPELGPCEPPPTPCW